MKAHLLRTTFLLGGLLLASWGTSRGQAQGQSARVRFLNPPGVAPPKGYSHAALVDLGTVRMLVVSGQVALGPDGAVVGPGSMSQQADQVFRNLKTIVEASGGNLSQVVKLTLFLTDIAQLPAVREVRDRYVNTAAPPASTAVQVSRLFRDGLLLEVEATAIIPKK